MTLSRPVLATPAILLLILFATELASGYEQSNLNKADMALSANTATEPLQGPPTISIDYTSEDNANKTTTSDIVVNNMSIAGEFEIPTDKTFIFMSIVYSISTLSAIVSNLIVILVYMFVQKTKTDLSIFLINLAVADFLAGTFCMPFSFAQVLLKKWIFGDTLCTLVLFQQNFSVSLSIYTMVAIGIDRYYAIKCPLKNRVSGHKVKFTMLIVWIISLSLASVQLFVARVQTHTSNHTQYDSLSNTTIFTSDSQTTCNETWSENQRRIYTVFLMFIVYIIPVIILGYTYTCIGCIIKQSKHPGNSDTARDMNYNKSKNKVVKMLIVLVCAFTLCWFPLHLFNILADFTNAFKTKDWFSEHTVNSFYYVSHWLAMANCTLNPVIYGYSTKKFRSDVYKLLTCSNWYKKNSWYGASKSQTQPFLANKTIYRKQSNQANRLH